jgi:Phage terminase, small subunit
MRKNPLKLVTPTKTNALAPPSTLGQAGATLWKTVQSEYFISDSGGRQILTQICEATDDLHDCTLRIEHDGAVISTRSGLKEHPLCRRQLALRAFITRSVQRLGLSLETASRPIGRPPGVGGPTFEDFEDD